MDYYAHLTAIIEDGASVGSGSKVWHFVHVRKGAKLGKNCNIGKGVYIDIDVSIGNAVKIQNFVSVYHGVTIEDDVFVGPSVTFTNDLYPRAWIWNEDRIAKTLVKKGASIGANATIVAGITIGRYAMIGMGSVVTKNVDDFQLIYGNPAKPQGWVCMCGKKVEKKPDNEICQHEDKK
ncbi:MAG TPA: DapH/DapD/GlmU-related protein [Candidatus Bilamarchaeaceae archaeon]|nr:DapH/DapD/GlmU-related protein [Candidatus Bilamarchaeaceae archaeon]